MQITNEMIHVALKKSIEAGLFPRHPLADEVARNEEVIQDILNAVMELIRPPASPGSSS